MEAEGPARVLTAWRPENGAAIGKPTLSCLRSSMHSCRDTNIGKVPIPTFLLDTRTYGCRIRVDWKLFVMP